MADELPKKGSTESNIHQVPYENQGPAENTSPTLDDAKLAAESANVSEKTGNNRPAIQFDSLPHFFSSLSARLRSIFTRRFVFAMCAGQLVSICIAATAVSTTELVQRGWALPTTQTSFLYFSLLVVYTPYTIWKYGFVGWLKMILKDGWKCKNFLIVILPFRFTQPVQDFILAAADVEGNFLVIKAYQYTDLLSCMLLDVWATPVCMFVAWIYMRPKYYPTQYLGIFISIVGLGLLVVSDQITDKDWEPLDRAKGDAFMIAGATLYGFTNATEEFLVRQRPFYEVVGQLGMWAFIINTIQATGLERNIIPTMNWNGATGGILVAYTAAMFILYTFAPLIYRSASSVYFNMSLLSSDFYGLIFGLGLYHYHPFWLYFIAFVVVLGGLVVYFWKATPEEQGNTNPQKPKYIKRGSEDGAESSPA